MEVQVTYRLQFKIRFLDTPTIIICYYQNTLLGCAARDLEVDCLGLKSCFASSLCLKFLHCCYYLSPRNFLIYTGTGQIQVTVRFHNFLSNQI